MNLTSSLFKSWFHGFKILLAVFMSLYIAGSVYQLNTENCIFISCKIFDGVASNAYISGMYEVAIELGVITAIAMSLPVIFNTIPRLFFCWLEYALPVIRPVVKIVGAAFVIAALGLAGWGAYALFSNFGFWPGLLILLFIIFGTFGSAGSVGSDHSERSENARYSSSYPSVFDKIDDENQMAQKQIAEQNRAYAEQQNWFNRKD